MNAEKNAIRILAATAVLLVLALVFIQKPATAQVTTKDNDYIACTYRTPGGSDALYIAETRQYGVISVFEYDRNQKLLVPRSARRIDEAFVAR